MACTLVHSWICFQGAYYLTAMGNSDIPVIGSEIHEQPHFAEGEAICSSTFLKQIITP